MSTTFLESGTAATQDLSFYDAVTYGAVSSDATVFHTGSRSLLCNTGAGPANAGVTKAGVLADVGRRVSFWFRTDTPAPTSKSSFVFALTAGLTSVWSIALSTSGKLVASPNTSGGTGAATGATTLSANTWYHICVSYYITNTTTFAIKVYLNGVLEATANTGTLLATASDTLYFTAQTTLGTSKKSWYSDAYVDTGASSSSQPATSLIYVTAKRPFANGTTNGFTGSGTPSSYGSGNARYVNEQPLNTANFVSVVAAGVTTEEYNIEGAGLGDVDLSAGATLVDYMGWLWAKALLSETASIIVNGASSNIALTSTQTMFLRAAGSTTYPAGTGADIGVTTTALATTVTLYECGVLFAHTQPTETDAYIDRHVTRGLNRGLHRGLA